MKIVLFLLGKCHEYQYTIEQTVTIKILISVAVERVTLSDSH